MKIYHGHVETPKSTQIFAFRSENEMNTFLGQSIREALASHRDDIPSDDLQALVWLCDLEEDLTSLIFFDWDVIDSDPTSDPSHANADIMKEAINAVLPHLDAEIEQRKHGGNDEIWSELQSVYDQLKSSLRISPEAQPKTTTESVTKHCPNCGSEDIIAVSDCRWNVEAQEWQATASGLQAQIDCQECDHVCDAPLTRSL